MIVRTAANFPQKGYISKAVATAMVKAIPSHC